MKKKSKRADTESIFKHLPTIGFANTSMEVNKKKKQDLDSFLIADFQLEPETGNPCIINTPSCLQKNASNETVGMSEETPKLSNIKTPKSKGI